MSQQQLSFTKVGPRISNTNPAIVIIISSLTFLNKDVDPSVTVDWLKAGKVTGIKNQGGVGLLCSRGWASLEEPSWLFRLPCTYFDWDMFLSKCGAPTSALGLKQYRPICLRAVCMMQLLHSGLARVFKSVSLI